MNETEKAIEDIGVYMKANWDAPDVQKQVLDWLQATAAVLGDILDERQRQFRSGFIPPIDDQINTSPYLWMGYVNWFLMKWFNGGVPNLKENLPEIRQAFIKAATTCVAAVEFMDRMLPKEDKTKTVLVKKQEEVDAILFTIKDNSLEDSDACEDVDPQKIFDFLK